MIRPIPVLFLLMLAVTHPAPAGRPNRARLTVVSLNTAKETDAIRILREISEVPSLRDADVMLLQEVAHAPGQGECVAEKIASALGRYVAYAPAAPGVMDQGLAILSRYPLLDKDIRILPAYHLVYRSRSRIALSVTIDAPSGSVRVTNAHLDTRINAEDRVRQLAPVLKDGFRGARIIGGDFNTNEFYWIGHVLPVLAPGLQGARVREFMTSNGFSSAVDGNPITHDLFMRLDWVFARGLKGNRWAVYPLAFSDHHALWVEMR